MKKRFYGNFLWFNIVLLFLLAINSILFLAINVNFAFISAILFIIGCLIFLIYYLGLQRRLGKFIKALQENSYPKSKLLSNFNIPTVYTSSIGEIIWCNDIFRKLYKSDILGTNIDELIKIDYNLLEETGSCNISIDKKEFSLYTSTFSNEDEYRIYYLIDDTKLKKIAREYAATRPVVMMLTLDNFDEILKNCKDSEKNSFKSAIQKEIENWLPIDACISTNLKDSKIFVILDDRSLNSLTENKFSILKSIRTLKINNISGVTLSIGVGRGAKNLAEAEIFCKQALEMAQSRGGDQVAIKSKGNEYKFFGGIAKAVERRTKVKARVISNAIVELFSSAEKIVFMGHKFSDLDCLGSAYGLSELAAFFNKPRYIVCDANKTLASPLLSRIIEEDKTCVICDGNDMDNVLGPKTLLVILDTHRPSFVENTELYSKCNNIIVIDHHRKAVDAIDNAVIFYHETATSSTCEMVAELVQYVDGYTPSKLAAEALSSGIMLDSKNFCLHTGVRTFEAAAYLRGCGADMAAVKKLFADNMRTYTRKSEIVASARIYEDCAIAFDETNDDISRLASSKAADEMLYLENINASFVICKVNEIINISARSLGAVNVQLIMENLGGGGHQNMAACQLELQDLNEAYKILIDAINKYKSNI